jgi:diacylglycerol kinase
MMTNDAFSSERTWCGKFRDAFRGLAVGVRGQNSFAVHLPMAVAVVICGFVLRVSLAQWGLLILCITAVLAAELFNSALESMAKAIDRRQNPHLGNALDISSAAVLLSAIGAATVGSMVLGCRLAVLLAS